MIYATSDRENLEKRVAVFLAGLKDHAHDPATREDLIRAVGFTSEMVILLLSQRDGLRSELEEARSLVKEAVDQVEMAISGDRSGWDMGWIRRASEFLAKAEKENGAKA